VNEIGNVLVVPVVERGNESVVWSALEVSSCKITCLCRFV
jgi:hypothetical protein